MVYADGLLRCTECRCLSQTGPGWVALLAQDPEEDEQPFVVLYCPPCAARVLEYPASAAYT